MREQRQSDYRTGTQIATARPDDAIRALADRQHGVVARRQLLAIGLTARMVTTRVGGQLVPLHRGVYAVGHRRLRREGFWLAAVLAGGPDAALSHRDAAALHGIRQPARTRVEITTRFRVALPGIDARRSALDPADRTVVDGVPVTTPARTLVDLADVVPVHQLVNALNEAARLRVIDMRAIDAARRRTRGRTGPGHARLAAAIAEIRTHGVTLTRSALEEAFLKLVREAGIPRPGTNVQVAGIEVDAAWRAERLVVELDGYAYHGTRRAFERDRERDALLLVAGWRVLRLTHRQVTERPGEVVRTLRAALAATPPRAPAAPAAAP